MYDNSLYFAQMSREKSGIISYYNLTPHSYILCTIHRDTNTDDATALQAIFEALLEIIDQTQLQVILPIHPRTQNKMEALLSPIFLEKIKSQTKLILCPPAGFLDMISLEENAKLIVTDSGGVQKEAYFFAKPCVILREQTEWVEVLQTGAAVLCGSSKELIVSSAMQLLDLHVQTDPTIFGDGKAAQFICQKIISDL